MAELQEAMRAGGRAGLPPFTINPLGKPFGAEVIGLDLAKPLAPGVREAIFEAFLEHHVLVFRDQDLTKEQQAAFTRNFGELEGHVVRQRDGSRTPDVQTVSNLDADGKPTKQPHSTGNYFWHTDKSYHAVPSLATLLHAVEVPADGGDTQFANMYIAYDALPAETKAAIADLKVVHSWEANRRNTGNRPASEEEKAERPPVTHPMVRTHPDTGRKTLYIGMHTSHIAGGDENDRSLLDQLLEDATKPAHVYTHRWRQGDLVMWDNRCLLHRAVANYEMDAHRRILHRTVIKGSVPY